MQNYFFLSMSSAFAQVPDEEMFLIPIEKSKPNLKGTQKV